MMFIWKISLDPYCDTSRRSNELNQDHNMEDEPSPPKSKYNMPQPSHTTVINFITSISISSQLRRHNARALFFLCFFCVICPNHRILLWYHLDSHIPLSTYCSSPILRVICPNHRILLWLTTPIIPISTLAQSPFLQNK